MKRCGVIFLDGAEVIIRTYETDDAGKSTLLHQQTRDLELFLPETSPKPSDVIEIIAETFFAGNVKNVNSWKVFARNIPEDIIREIRSATKFTVENLLLIREQELICNGILQEF